MKKRYYAQFHDKKDFEIFIKHNKIVRYEIIKARPLDCDIYCVYYEKEEKK